MNLIWEDLVKEEVRTIYSFLYDLSPVAAENWSNELEKKANLLLAFPEMGRIVPEFNISFIREVFAGKYRIVYSYQDDTVRILAVRSMAAPLGKL